MRGWVCMPKSAGYAGSRASLERMLAQAHQELRDIKNAKFLAEQDADRAILAASQPLVGQIFCPVCKEQHICEGNFATKPHKRHACQTCGLVWSPFGDAPTIGVRFLPGCVPVASDKEARMHELLRRLNRLWKDGEVAVVGDSPRAKQILDMLAAIGGVL